jgi:pyruvate kinase
MNHFPKTKIVATLGPRSADVSTLRKMIEAGMNVARLNFSHGDHASNQALVSAVKAAESAVGIPVAILQDLGGPKIRIGDFATETVTLTPRQTFTLTTKSIVGSAERVHVSYQKLPREVTQGASILLNDGKLHLKVRRTTDTDIETEVVIGGTIRGRRGVNVPGAGLSISAITPKDKRDLAFGLSLGVHFVTLSFVRTAAEVGKLRRLLGNDAERVGIIAKIETKEAIENIDAIIAAADGIMVARGDLAIEIPRAEVPLVQKQIIAKCNEAGKPVITATQMLDSMREQEVPTRAEVNDVANAILDGSDAIMLSDETTVGQFPVAAVAMMRSIADTVERHEHTITRTPKHAKETIADSIATAAAREAKVLGARAIVALSESGTTGRLIARHRPDQPIIILTPHTHTYYQLLLSYGCIPHKIKPVHSLKEAVRQARHTLTNMHIAKAGDRFVLNVGTAFGESGSINMLLVEVV